MKEQAQNDCCTVSCPAIRDDGGSFYCRIMRASVAPYEHRVDYGFDVVKEGKITHSGYHTPCEAKALFHHNDAATRADERERLLNVLKQTDIGACPYPTCKSDGINCRDCLIAWLKLSPRSSPPLPEDTGKGGSR
jgi:hypothetical protein